ncbi:MAG: Gfo/Idh/MocA family protein [Bacillota bacterium]
MTEKITMGVVGLGGIARKAHLPVLAVHPQVEIVGLASRTGGGVAELAAQYRLDLKARSFAEILACRPRAAYLLSVTTAHPEQAVALLEAGIAVFMEKPLANTVAEAEAIVKAASKPDRLLMVGFNRRFAPAYRRARALFAETGRPIELAVIQKHRSADPSNWSLRQSVMDDTIHIIDLARFFGGDLQVKAAHVRSGLVVSHFETPLSQNGTVVQIAQSYGAGSALERVELQGGGMTVIVEQMERLTVIENGVERVEPLFGSWTATLEKRGIGPELDHFLDCLRTGVQPETNGAEALATQRLAEAMLLAGGRE